MKMNFKLLLIALGLTAIISCNNNKGKGNDTTEAGTERYEDVNDPMENRTPTPSMTADSTGATAPVKNDSITGKPDPR